MKYLRPLEIEAFIFAAKQCSQPKRLLMLFLLFTGCRVSEAISVKVEDVRFALLHDKKTFQIPSLKSTRKKRHLYLADSLIEELKEYLMTWNTRLSGPLFTDMYGTMGIHRQTAFRWIKEIMVAVGRPELSPHSLRHTAAKLALRKGASLPAIQKFLGHDSIASTGIYLEADDDEILNVLNPK